MSATSPASEPGPSTVPGQRIPPALNPIPPPTAYVVILTGQEDCGGHSIGSELARCLNTPFTRGVQATESARTYARLVAGNVDRDLHSHVFQRTWFVHMLRLGFSTSTTWVDGRPTQQRLGPGTWLDRLVRLPGRPGRDANLRRGEAMRQTWDCRGVISSSRLMKSGREAITDLLVREHGIRPVFVVMQIESRAERLDLYGGALEEGENENGNGNESEAVPVVSQQGPVNVGGGRMGEHVERVGVDTVLIRSYGRDIDGLLGHILHETARIVNNF